MNIDKYGAVIVNQEELFDAIYSGSFQNFNNLYLDDSNAIDQFNRAVKENFENFKLLEHYREPESSLEIFDKAAQGDWLMPKESKEFPIIEWLYNKCQTEDQKKRVDEELLLFVKHGMFDLLLYLKFLVDTMRQNNVVWGVGRGSSVASYVLYLLGIHRIDSIKYNLDITEFLK
jgi:DNA polymerase III alpha subunit